MAPLDLEPNQLQTPQELLESVHQQLRAELADDLLRRINEAPPILAGHHAKKGVFITTSRFADNAREYAATVEAKVILIDGQELAQLGVFYATPRLGHFYKVFL